MVRMERAVDKLIVYALCLGAMLAVEPLGALDPAAAPQTDALRIATCLVAAICAALFDALPERMRAASPLACALGAALAPEGIFFLPLSCYDALRGVHASGWQRAVAAFPPACLVAACTLWGTAPAAGTLVALLCVASAVLSARTSRLLARQDTLFRMRDEMVQRARALQAQKHELEQRLDAATHPVGTQAAPVRPRGFEALTEREFEVARLIAEGLDNREIAAAAYMSEGTVRNHISSMLAKLHLKNRTQIAIAFWRP